LAEAVAGILREKLRQSRIEALAGELRRNTGFSGLDCGHLGGTTDHDAHSLSALP
jgi:hypothetical protein